MNDKNPQQRISSTAASSRFGVTNDYVTLLCRQKKVAGKLVGRMWQVDEASLAAFLQKTKLEKEAKRAALSARLKSEYRQTATVPYQVDAPEGAGREAVRALAYAGLFRAHGAASPLHALAILTFFFGGVTVGYAHSVLRAAPLAHAQLVAPALQPLSAAVQLPTLLAQAVLGAPLQKVADSFVSAIDTAPVPPYVSPEFVAYVPPAPVPHALVARVPLAAQQSAAVSFADVGAFFARVSSFFAARTNTSYLADVTTVGTIAPLPVPAVSVAPVVLPAPAPAVTEEMLNARIVALANFLLPKIEIARISPRNSSGASSAHDSSLPSAAPAYGQVLVGNGDGSYDLVATSSLGIVAGGDASADAPYPFPLAGNATSTLTQFNAGITAYASTTIGDGTQTGGLTVYGGATTTGNAYFAGNVGIGTASPASPLAVTYSDNSFGRGISVRNTNVGSQAVSGIKLQDSSGNDKGIFDYISSNYQNTLLRNTVLFGSVDDTKLGFVAGTGSGNPDIYFQSGANNAAALYIQGSSQNVGIGTSSPYAKLSVSGQVVGAYFTATTTSTSTLPRLSSTGISVDWICLTADTCRTSWPSGGSSLTGTTGQFAYFSGTNSAVGTSSLFITPSGNIGVGTSSPYAKLTVWGASASSGNALEIANSASTSLLTLSNAGLFSVGSNGSNVFTVDATTGSTTIANLSIGNLNFDTNAGVVALSNIPVDSGAASGVIQSQSINIGDTSVLTVYGESNGSGGVQNLRVGIGTTSPYAKLSVAGQVVGAYFAATTTTQNVFPSVLSTNATTTSQYITGLAVAAGAYLAVDPDGRVIATTTPVSDAGSSFEYPFPSAATSTPLTFSGGITVSGTATSTGMFRSVPSLSLASATTSGLSSPMNIAVAGTYAYIASQGNSSIVIFDVSDPDSPTKVSTLTSGINSPYSVAVAGRYAYVANYGDSTLAVVDVSNPKAPVTVGTGSGTLQYPTFVTVAGRYAYLSSGGTSAVVIYDVSNPAAPVEVGHTTTGLSSIGDLAISGRYAYVADYDHGLVVFDISNPTAPSYVTSVSTVSSGYQTVAIQGNYAYVGSGGDNKLLIYDISNPASPALKGSVDTDLYGPNRVAVSGRYAYVANGSGGNLIVYDINDPSAPYEVAISQTDINSPYGLAVSGRYAYTSGIGDQKFGIYDTGGIQAAAADIGSLTAQSLNVSGTIMTAAGLIANSLNVGTGGIFSSGPLSVSVASSTQTNPLSAYFQGAVGIGTTSPWARLSIDTSSLAAGVPEFAVGSSTRTHFVITQSGNVGVGTSSPYAKLSVAGEVVASNFTATSTSATSTFAGGLSVGNGALTYDYSSGVTSINNLAIGSFTFDTDAGIVPWADLPISSSASAGTVESYTANIGGSNVLTVYGEADGNGYAKNLGVGIGTSSPAYLLDVATSTSAVVVARFTNGTGSCTINPTSGSLGCTSDERLKKNFTSLASAATLQKVLALNPLFYNWLSETDTSPKHSGFVAQQIKEIFPDLVSEDSASGYYTLNYAGFTPYLTAAVQALDLRLEAIASLSATSTPDSESFASSFFANLFAQIRSWLASASNGITKLFAHEVHTDLLCVGDTCVTQEQFLALVTAAGTGSTHVAPDTDAGGQEASSTEDVVIASSTPQVPPPDSSQASSTPEAEPQQEPPALEEASPAAVPDEDSTSSATSTTN